MLRISYIKLGFIIFIVFFLPVAAYIDRIKDTGHNVGVSVEKPDTFFLDAETLEPNKNVYLKVIDASGQEIDPDSMLRTKFEENGITILIFDPSISLATTSVEAKPEKTKAQEYIESAMIALVIVVMVMFAVML